jgi:ATP-dependent DNA helicase RecQ
VPQLKPAQRARLNRTLQKVFGHDRMREAQEPVIANVLAHRHTLAILPTGAGKSLCYQLPALALPGRTLVISPLIALMKDQVDKLAEAGVHAIALNSAQSATQQADAWRALDDGSAEFVFTTPERLADSSFVAELQRAPPSLVVIDEAHCISQWGHDFRPAYLAIGAAVAALGPPTVLGLTATANEQVIEDIGRQLGLPFDVMSGSVYRANLTLAVLQSTRDEERTDQASRIVTRSEGSGIVYTATVRAAEALYEALIQAGASVGLYHGRLRASERHAQQEAFMRGEVRIMVATNAFGLGIDKPDIRFVLHYQLPPGLDAYYQEAGRAGRDGAPARCTLIYQHSDQRLRQFLQAGRYPTAKDVTACIDVLAALPPESGGLTLAALVAAVPVGETKVKVVAELLKEHGMIRQTRERRLVPVPSRLDRAKATELSVTYRERAQRDKRELERIAFYARTGFCRWKVLLEHFGDPREIARCGHCDNCLHPPARRLAKPTRPGRVPAPPPLPRPAYAIGQYARVRRYGVGRVIATSAQSVTLEFPDGSRRDFLPSFLRPAPAAGR